MLRRLFRSGTPRGLCLRFAPTAASSARSCSSTAATAADAAPGKLACSYPSFVATSTVATLLRDHFPAGAAAPSVGSAVSVGGRVAAVRDMGKVAFLTIHNDGEPLQIVYAADAPQQGGSAAVGPAAAITKEDVKRVTRSIKAGDIIGVVGAPGVTKKGERSVFAREIVLLTKYCGGTVQPQPQQPQPQQQQEALASGTNDKAAVAVAPAQQANCCPPLTGFKSPADPEMLYRYRFVDLMCNRQSQRVFRTRARVISALRAFLDGRGFVEVETPVFHTVPAGAAARPFRTHHEDSEADLFLRIAPELYLKQCVVGGLERVYEIGRVFRNEGSDRSHNPEFTSCEFYQAFATYRELMAMTEELVRAIAAAALAPPASESGEATQQEPPRLVVTVERRRAAPDAEHGTQPPAAAVVEEQVDFSAPFRVVDIVTELERRLAVRFPQPLSELDTPDGAEFLSRLLAAHSIPMPTPASPAKLFDKLIDHFITDDVVQPTFVVGHPVFMSPLAKEDPRRPGIAERFELFVNGMELCNAYSELNDPVEQKHRFEQQLKQRIVFNDAEAQCVDETFLKALQVGLPPTAGWGMGIDRVVMLLCGASSIRDVLLFPLLKHRHSGSDAREAKRRRAAAGLFAFDPHMTTFCLHALEAEFVRRGVASSASLVRGVHDAMAKLDIGNSASSAVVLGSEKPSDEVAVAEPKGHQHQQQRQLVDGLVFSLLGGREGSISELDDAFFKLSVDYLLSHENLFARWWWRE